MSKIDDGGPAFPESAAHLRSQPQFEVVSRPGMSLRDYFAAAALTSLLSTPDKIGESTYATAAQLSYRFADAMLTERAKAGATI